MNPPDFVCGFEKVSARWAAKFAPKDGGLQLGGISAKQQAAIRSAFDGDTLPTHFLMLRRAADGSANVMPFLDWYHGPAVPAEQVRWDMARASISVMRLAVEKLVAERKATHLILFSAGWHMEQADAVSGAGWMLDSLHAQAKKSGVPFRPVTIALTWPAGLRDGSVLGRLTQVSDFPGRSDDADEIGSVWGSRVIGNVLLPAPAGTRTVVIGHSLGARLLASAVASRALLPRTERTASGAKIDCLIGLQAAFPRDRFVHENSDIPGGSASKGACAAILNGTTNAFFSTSSNDRVIGVAGSTRNMPFGLGKLAPTEHYMGSYMTSADIPKYPAFENAFAPMWVLKNKWPSFPAAKNRVIVADCSEIIGSHNDVWGNAALSTLLLRVMR